ncbi:hypothetical protein Tco_0759633 [Tanacetum coccineum]
MEENLVSTEARAETRRFKLRLLCGIGSKGVDHVINSRNKRIEISKLYKEWDKKSIRIETVGKKDQQIVTLIVKIVTEDTLTKIQIQVMLKQMQ